MSDTLTIAMAQINVTVGDIVGNCEKILKWREKAKAQGADLIVFPEMAITGYPPEDLVLRRRFQEAAMEAAIALARVTNDGGPAMLVGGLWRDRNALYNAAFLMDGGEAIHVQHKVALPNYGVFDEKRVFTPGAMPEPVEWRGSTIGILICEDMWDSGVAQSLIAKGAEMIISINASPYEMGKAKLRREQAREHVTRHGVPLMYVNMICGQDELVFDGRSFVMNGRGEYVGRLYAFREQLASTTWSRMVAWECMQTPNEVPLGNHETAYRAMMLGLKDYVEKNKFAGVIIGMSGGVDSALTAAVAVDALGKERVRGVLMPSPYTSHESMEDASKCAGLLGMKLDTIDILPGMQAYERMLAMAFAGKEKDTTEENIQARIRGNILMAISNKFNLMVLTTGNKSEMSVGYATLYGDMCGGYSVLKDVYKTTVYKLCQWRNANRPEDFLGPAGRVMPERVIIKAPTAELKPNQKDQDTLPPYEVLDGILHAMVERQMSVEEITKLGYERPVVEKVSKMLYSAEYKRRQAPPGVKITGMSFGRDRRYPITNRFMS